jgi:hypothetical protein
LYNPKTYFELRLKIAQQIDDRSGKDCRSRYVNYVDPGLKRTMWTHEEDAVIKRMHKSLGDKWSKFMAFLPGRSDNAIRTRYHIISRNNYSEHNHHSIVKRAFLLDAAATRACKDGSKPFVPETIAVRLQRFRLARDLMDAKINMLLAATELNSTPVKEYNRGGPTSTAGGGGGGNSTSKQLYAQEDDEEEDAHCDSDDSTCSTSLSGSEVEDEDDININNNNINNSDLKQKSLSSGSFSSISTSFCSPPNAPSAPATLVALPVIAETTSDRSAPKC